MITTKDNTLNMAERRLDPFECKKFFSPLGHIPKEIYIRGNLPNDDITLITIVGSRRHSSYGEQVTKDLIKYLSEYKIGIVSGLAFGIDSIAHREALKNNLYTVAFPGSGLDDDTIAPNLHLELAHNILKNGGALISPFKSKFKANNWTFASRNRLMAGISKLTILIEASKNSGTMITGTAALNFGLDVGAIPGSIFSDLSIGTNELIKNGAYPITSGRDILDILGIKAKEEDLSPKDKTDNSSNTKTENDNHKEEIGNKEKIKIYESRTENLGTIEKEIINIIFKNDQGLSADEIIKLSNLDTREYNKIISLLELDGLIKRNSNRIYFNFD